jgi:FMN phosphatase YigB (HAD superfamily)
MPLTLEQYATWLDARDLPWPSAPDVERPKAKPHLVPLSDVRVVVWSIYGTLLNLAGGELWFEHPQRFIMDLALDKTVQEFKMWGSMSRKPGQPAEYLGQIYRNVLSEHRLAPSGGEKHPEINSERIWEAIVKKLFAKDYKLDTGFYGSLNEFSRKVAYFFHASLQGTACYPGAAAALAGLFRAGIAQGLVTDAQCFTMVQLQRGLVQQDATLRADQVLDASLCVLSHEQKARKPSERLFRHLLEALEQRGIAPSQVLHVGSRISRDIAPARKLGMRTALFAGDKASLEATPDQLRDPASRPDVLLTELDQIVQVVSETV